MNTKRSSIRTDLLRLVLVVSLPLLTAVGIDIYFDFQQSIAYSKTSLRTLASTMARNTGGTISHAREVLERLAVRSTVQRMDGNHCDPLLQELQTMDPAYANTAYTNLDGLAICSALAQPGHRPLDATKLHWYQEFRKTGRFSVGQPHFGPISKKWVSVLSAPVRNAQQEMVGAVHLSLDLKNFNPNIPDSFLPTGSRYGFFSEDGIMIWRNLDPEGVIGTRPNAEAARRIVQIRDGEFESLAVDGVTRYFSVVSMPDVGWVAFVGVPADHIYAPATQRALWMALLAVVGIGLTVLAAIAIARRISAPISALEQSAHAIHEGRLDVRAALDGPHEVAAVAQEFNAMLDSQEAHESQLRAFLDNSAVIAWLKDETGRHVFVSDNFLKRLGLSRDDVIGKMDAEVFPPHIACEFRRNDEKMLAAGHGVEVVESTSNPDGSLSWWQSCKFVYTQKDGRRFIGGLAVDISQRIQVESELGRAKAMTDAAFEQTPIPMVLISLPDGVLRYVNSAAVEFLGISDEPSYVGQPLVEIQQTWMDYDADGNPQPIENMPLLRAAQGEFVLNQEYYVITKQGQQRWELVTAAPIYNPQGERIAAYVVFPEITERKRAEVALKESEARWKFALEGSGDGVWDWNIQTGEALFSTRWKEMLGYAEFEIANRADEWSSRVHPDDLPKVMSVIQAHLDGKTSSAVVEHRLLHKAGHWIWVQGRGMVVSRDAEGKPVRLIGTNSDITDREQAAEALRQSEETFRKLFEDSSDAILLIDGSGVFVECNQAALNLLKMTREQFLLLPPSRISPEFQPDGRRSEDAAPEMIALAYSQGLHRFDWTCINAEGGEFIVEVSLMPVFIKGQTMLHTTWRDVTARIRSERNFRNAMMFMPIPIGIANTEGEIVFFNEAFSSTYGYVVGDFARIEDWYDRVYPDPVYREEVMASWGADVADAMKSGHVTPRREYRITSKNGSVKRVIITMRPIDGQFVTAFEDITQSKLDEEELTQHRLRLEHLVNERTRELAGKNRELENALEQLRQAQEHLIQESKLSSLGELVAGIAHELNTPIGNARTVSSALYDQGEDFVHRIENNSTIRKSEFLEFLHHVTEGTHLLQHNLVRASDLIQSFKQVAVDRASSQRRRFNLRKVAEEVILTLHPTLKKTPFVLETDISPEILIEGYPGPLGQIIVNLIDNALIHGLHGRTSGKIRVTGQQSGQMVEIEVADDGIGIPKENLPRIFDPFFTTRLGQGGSGLGLNIVFNIVNGLLGGKITVDSTYGEGVRFRIFLPLLAPISKGEQANENRMLGQ